MTTGRQRQTDAAVGRRQGTTWLGAAMGALWLLVALAGFAPARAIEVQRVVSPGGIEAWLVQDQSVPVLAVEFAFEGGAALDPPGKEGLANLVSTLLDEGAGPYDSQAFQKRLADNAISLSFDAGYDAFFGSLKTALETRDAAVELTRLALTAPRFDAEAVTRMTEATLARIRYDLSDPNYVAGRVFDATVFPDHPYGRPVRGTLETVPAITVQDLRAFVAGRFARDNLTVGVTGDITPEALGPLLDDLFGDLPRTAAPYEVADVTPKGAGEVVVVPRPLPQSVIALGHEGIRRDDPDWYAATVMNHILGGGGFGSRLMEEIREERGLSYGVYSYLLPLDHAALIMAGGATVNASAGTVLELMRETWRGMAEQGVTEAELADAKIYLTGSFPLRFSSTDRIAQILVSVQREKLGLDYLDRRNALIEAVTLEDVNRAARRLLRPDELTVVVVGQPEDISPTRVIDGDGAS